MGAQLGAPKSYQMPAARLAVGKNRCADLAIILVLVSWCFGEFRSAGDVANVAACIGAVTVRTFGKLADRCGSLATYKIEGLSLHSV